MSKRNIGGRFSVASALVVGLLSGVIYFSMGGQIAIQDTRAIMAAMTKDRWSVALEKSRPDSIAHPSYSFSDADGMTTGSIQTTAGQARIDIPVSKADVEATSDEDRVNRSEKRGRLVRVAPRGLPERFKAGSLYGERSMLLRPTFDIESSVAFEQAMPIDKALELAEAFRFAPGRGSDAPASHTMLASLDDGDESVPVSAAAYAPTSEKSSPFDAVLGQPGRGFIPNLGKKDHQWAAQPLPESAYSDTQQRCLAIGVYFEARGESEKGQVAVAQVILNRVKNPTYPDTICGVVYQNKQWRNRCQFSFACDGLRDRVRSPKAWQIAEKVAREATYGEAWLPEVGSSTHYHATYVKPRWASHMERLQRIGRHIFYRTTNGGWG